MPTGKIYIELTAAEAEALLLEQATAAENALAELAANRDRVDALILERANAAKIYFQRLAGDHTQGEI